MYRDEIFVIRYPGLFGLINNKKKKYIYACLKKLKILLL